MSRITMLVGCMLVIVLLMGVISYAVDPLPNSQCLPRGDWKCIRQSKRLCAKFLNENPGKKCEEGTCYDCSNGSDTLPVKMCFDVEGGPGCTPVDPYVCADKWPDGKCVVVEDTCICKTTKEQSGQCTFTSCNE